MTLRPLPGLLALLSLAPAVDTHAAESWAVFNVRDFGAVGDGATKDTAAFQKALDTGDDAILLKSGRGLNGARLGKPVEDVLITGCTLRCSRFAAIGIGREISGGVRNIRIEHSKLSGKIHAIDLKTRIGRAGVRENIVGDDLNILSGGFLRINLTVGGNANTADDPVEGLVGYPSAKNLSFSNVRLANVTGVVDAVQVAPEKPVEGFSLTNISGTATKGIDLQHVKGAVLRDITSTALRARSSRRPTSRARDST